MSHVRFLGSSGLLTLAVVLASGPAAAQPSTPEKLPEVVVTADAKAKPAPVRPTLASPLGAFTLSGQPIDTIAPQTNDTAAVLTAVPGVDAATGGGVSSLPVIHGMASDRINVLNFGMAITSACANHMNPPLSYVDPAAIGSVEVLSGVTPVSKGGDSIAGSIIVERKPPAFAAADKGVEVHGSLGANYRSNGNGLGASLTASVANRDWFLEYTGAWSKSDNVKAGGNGGTIHSTEYEAQNHLLTLAKRTDSGLFTLSGGIQNIPKQGFPNAWMDMLYNRSQFVNAAYEGAFDWGRLDAKAYWHHTDHYMNFLADKGGSTPTSGMPMYTRGNDAGWSVKGTIDLSAKDILRIGDEFHHTGLDDWWPPVGMMPGMMCCNTYMNINGGRRDRFGNFAEWEHVWSKEWSTLIGARLDVVDMNTGKVQSYDPADMDAAAAAAFNARDHHKTDVNLDLTALARWNPDERTAVEFGYARKTRSPNLYERYAWGVGGMATQMIGWFGDGNGYIGNLDLKPEIAHTVSTTLSVKGAGADAWGVKVTPWVSYVQDYIDADRVGTMSWPGWPTFAKLKFANHDAALWGFDASAHTAAWKTANLGDFTLAGTLAYTHGENLDSHDGLYRVMPLNGTIALQHKLDAWTNALTLKAVAAKTDVSTTRFERTTPAYALVDYRTGYHWGNIDVSVGVDNLFDKKYALPLGGLNLVDRPVDQLLGTGRSVWAGVKISF